MKTVVIALLAAGQMAFCSAPKNMPRPNGEMPAKMLWAWERPEDLKFLDVQKFGVAFLSQTILLENESVIFKPRRQPLELAPDTYVLAVTRIETNKDRSMRPSFAPEMIQKISDLVKTSLSLPNVRGIQIDFDASLSERQFYGSLMTKLRRDLPPGTPLIMTSLASWCTGDAWFNNFPVDEAVPMPFQMGADEEKIKNFLRSGNDWREPLCRASYGISVDDPLNVALRPGRRIYYFSDHAWTRSVVERLN